MPSRFRSESTSPWPARVGAALALQAALCVGCAHAQTPPASAASAPAHHRGGTFQNNYLEYAPKSLWQVLSWQLSRARDGVPKPPQQPTPVVAPDLDFVRGNAKAGAAMVPAVTWIGHATALLQLGGINVLTDPIFAERASPLSFIGPKRVVPPGVALADLPRIDVVVVSHNHYDHCDVAAMKALTAQPGGPPLYLVPLGLKDLLAAADIPNVQELDWWQSRTVGGVEIVMTPVQHWSGRGINDRLATLWGGYAFFAADQHVFFAGDTGYSQDFADVGKRFAARNGGRGFDLALVPIGAYEPRSFMQMAHVNPDESVKIHRDVGARRSVGIHWGTFELTDESLDDPPRVLAAARQAAGVSEDAFFVLAIG